MTKFSHFTERELEDTYNRTYQKLAKHLVKEQYRHEIWNDLAEMREEQNIRRRAKEEAEK